MENLTCEQCSQTWQRVPARGRKPKVCPTCIQSVSSTLTSSSVLRSTTSSSSTSSSHPLEYKFPAPTYWKCPSCGVGVHINIPLMYEPTHCCQKRLKKSYPLELVRS